MQIIILFIKMVNLRLTILLLTLNLNNALLVLESKLINIKSKQIGYKNENINSYDNLPTVKKKGNKLIVNDRLWKKDNISFTILGNIAYYNQTSEHVVEKVVREAFKEWQHYSPLVFIFKKDFKQADIKLIFTRDSYSADPHLNSYNHICERTFQNNEAHAYFANHPLHPGEIHVNNQVFWLESTNPRGSVSLKSILLHEIGHAIGLQHSLDRESIMYPYFYTNSIKSITINDAIELNSMYRQLCD